MKTKIIGTGLSGLVGSRIVELLQDEYDFEDLSLDTGVDITKRDDVAARIAGSKARVVLHLAAVVDVDGCEGQRDQDKHSLAWKVNVIGTKNIVRAVKETDKRLIHISTDFVFSGLENEYSEKSKPNPINWYGETKYRAELIVQEELVNYVVLRIAFPYRAKFERSDIVRFFINKLKNGSRVNAVDDWIITPTFTDDLSKVIKAFVLNTKTGIYHAVGSSSLSPYEIALTVARLFGFDKNLVQAVNLKDFFLGKAPRPERLVIDNGKITRLDLYMQTLEQGLDEIKRQSL